MLKLHASTSAPQNCLYGGLLHPEKSNNMLLLSSRALVSMSEERWLSSVIRIIFILPSEPTRRKFDFYPMHYQALNASQDLYRTLSLPAQKQSSSINVSFSFQSPQSLLHSPHNTEQADGTEGLRVLYSIVQKHSPNQTSSAGKAANSTKAQPATCLSPLYT